VDNARHRVLPYWPFCLFWYDRPPDIFYKHYLQGHPVKKSNTLIAPVIAALFTASLLTAPLTFVNAAETDAQDDLSMAVESLTEQTQNDALTEEAQYQLWAESFNSGLNRQTGKIQLPNGAASLMVPENFYYLSPADADRVLVEAWGNPPGGETQGMLFPSAYGPLDTNAWGVTIEYEEEGYVSDEDAADIDYRELLTQMQADTADSNPSRLQAGYPPIELLGWAAAPRYNAATHKLYWAQELKFGEGEEAVNTLNYNIRMLGRKGVLVVNFIAGMDQLPEIESNLDTVLAMAEFEEGSRYADFDPDIDTVAAYGLGALVTGKVLAKTGFLAVLLIGLKKFWIIGLVAVGGLLARVFKGKKNGQV
jgi:uncharacterized membrane-anchored protein